MSLEGTVSNGSVILDDTTAFPEGARVEVTLKSNRDVNGSVGDRLLALAGLIDDGPVDLAEQHDHYLHGTAKR